MSSPAEITAPHERRRRVASSSARASRSTLPVTLLISAVVMGSAAGIAFHQRTKGEFIAHMTGEAETLLALTQAYVSSYSELHGLPGSERLPVPASFRATASAAFNARHAEGEQITARMVGVPGRELVTGPSDSAMRQDLARMVASGDHAAHSDLTRIEDVQLLRSIFPSKASSQHCADCHNRLQPTGPRWQPGDLMGAYVIDHRVGPALARLRQEAALAGVVFGLLVLLALFMLVQHRALARKSRALQTLADTDPLTGCINRRALFDQVNLVPDSAERPGAVLALDLDRFKAINDQHGHAAGDAVLVEFAERVRANLRSNDLFARVGGEEFLIHLPNVNHREAAFTADRLLHCISDAPILVGDRALEVTVSVGAVTLVADTRFTFEHYMKVADAFLYRAKRAGRNQVATAALLPD